MEQIKHQIVEAFKKHQPHLLAIREEWGVVYINGVFKTDPNAVKGPKRIPCCCGLGVLMLGKVCEVDGREIDEPDDAVHWVLNLNEEYVRGFIAGFDGSDFSAALSVHKEGLGESNEKMWSEGFRDGASTWDELEENHLIYVAEGSYEQSTIDSKDV